MPHEPSCDICGHGGGIELPRINIRACQLCMALPAVERFEVARKRVEATANPAARAAIHFARVALTEAKNESDRLWKLYGERHAKASRHGLGAPEGGA